MAREHDYNRTMRKLSHITTLLVGLLLMSGCTNGLNALKLYRVPVQQGNIVTQDMIDKIKPGMTKSQVAFVLGEPVLRDPFNESKWIYIYSIEVPGLFTQKTRTTLFGVEKEKFFLDLIDFSSNKFLKSSKIFSLKFF